MVKGVGFLTDHENGDFGEFSASEEFQNLSTLDSQNLQGDGGLEYQSSEQEVSNKNMRLSLELNEQIRPLGLKLRKTPSFIDLLEQRLTRDSKSSNQTSDEIQSKMDDFASQPMSEKLKASNFPASVLRIGSWERISRNEGDLVTKCYYAKRKLVWEILEGALKSKMEIQWSDILGINAIIRDHEPGILEIELNQPPLFYREADPRPRKHTLWEQASDFTGSQALVFRRHYVLYPPGALDKHYEKLLNCDQRLLILSQRPFPSQESPYFHPNRYGFTEFSPNFNRRTPAIPYRVPPPGLQYPDPSVSAHFLCRPHLQNFRPMPRASIGMVNSNSQARNGGFGQNRTIGSWGTRGGLHNVNNFQRGEQIQRPTSVAFAHAEAKSTSFFQDYAVLNEGEAVEGMNALREIEKFLLSDSQILCSDENTLLENMNSLLEPNEVYQTNASNTNPLEYGHKIFADDRLTFNASTENLVNNDKGPLCPRLNCWMPPQDLGEGRMMVPPRNDNSLNPYASSEEQKGENFAAPDSTLGAFHN